MSDEPVRPRRQRPEGWLAAAIARGEVADPEAGPEPHRIYPETTFVLQVPAAEMVAKVER